MNLVGRDNLSLKQRESYVGKGAVLRRPSSPVVSMHHPIIRRRTAEGDPIPFVVRPHAGKRAAPRHQPFEMVNVRRFQVRTRRLIVAPILIQPRNGIRIGAAVGSYRCLLPKRGNRGGNYKRNDRRGASLQQVSAAAEFVVFTHHPPPPIRNLDAYQNHKDTYVFIIDCVPSAQTVQRDFLLFWRVRMIGKSPASNASPSATTATRVYLDYNATTPVEPAVLDAMLPYFTENFANASSIHTPGQRARSAVETAREQVAVLIGANPKEIVFTSGGTESDNHAIFGIDASHLECSTSLACSRHIITSAIEHEAVLNACQELEKRGVSVTYLPFDKNGLVDPAAVRTAIRPETVLITIMHANNELGTVQPLEKIGRIAAEADIYFHTDAVQSVGKIPVDVNTLGVDLLGLSGHKIYAPKGIGALYIRSGTRLPQLLYGGHHQRGARPGTENVAGIVGLGAAAAIARQSLTEDAARVSALRDRLEFEILARVPDTRANAAAAPRTPNTTNIIFSGVEGEALLIALDLRGLACSTGAACSSGAVEPSHVLTAIGLTPEDARASLRFSLGRHTTSDEIDFALQVVPAAVTHLRSLSSTYGRTSAVVAQRV